MRESETRNSKLEIGDSRATTLAPAIPSREESVVSTIFKSTPRVIRVSIFEFRISSFDFPLSNSGGPSVDKHKLFLVGSN
ncbi:MAG: hypothetical protein DMG27_10635 [Acidobacteria bacterium]|nr:MAG: hypothetical protein DMG27_10635 [Acidobacteriota bacterium]